MVYEPTFSTWFNGVVVMHKVGSEPPNSIVYSSLDDAVRRLRFYFPKWKVIGLNGKTVVVQWLL